MKRPTQGAGFGSTRSAKTLPLLSSTGIGRVFLFMIALRKRNALDVRNTLPHSNALPFSNTSRELPVPQVLRSVEIHAPPSVVWRWLATQEALRRWFSPSLEIDLHVGGAYRFFGPDNETWISGKVLELKPEESLILSWLEEGADWLHPMRLVITLAPTQAGTRVTLVHDGFAGTPDWRAAVEDYERGADEHRILEKLAELVNADAIV